MIDTQELFFRLASGIVAGGLIGMNRELHRKAVGVRTLGLVGLGCAFLTLSGTGLSGNVDANASRVIQGIVTGIGFLGAGVIVKDENRAHVHGLTTASAIWVTSAIGIACGLGEYRLVLIVFGLMALLLLVGAPLDRAIQTWWAENEDFIDRPK